MRNVASRRGGTDDKARGEELVQKRARQLEEEFRFVCISLVDPRLFSGDAAPFINWTFYSGSCRCSMLVPFPSLPFLYPSSPPLRSHSPPNMTAVDPPSSDSAPDIEHKEYKYESEGEQLLVNSARTLLELAEGNHHCKLIARIYELYVRNMVFFKLFL